MRLEVRSIATASVNYRKKKKKKKSKSERSKMTATRPTEQICKRSLISGRVQGVSFQYYACKKALTLGLTGSIRNLPDGRVEALIQGDRAVVEAMSYWFWKGSPQSHVEAVETEERDLQAFQDFEIQY